MLDLAVWHTDEQGEAGWNLIFPESHRICMSHLTLSSDGKACHHEGELGRRCDTDLVYMVRGSKIKDDL